MSDTLRTSPPLAPARRVLVLEDDSSTLLILSHRLQSFGLEVIACREIEAAEAILDHSRVDAVITDLCVSPLGGLEGTRLVRHVATNFPETDLLVMSSHTGEDVKRLVMAFGASAFFDKPVDAAVLARQILRGRPPLEGAEQGRILDVETLDEFLAANPIFAVLQPIVALQEGGSPPPIFGLESLARAPRESVLKNPEILFEYAARKERLYETDLLCVRAGLDEARRVGKGFRLFLNVQPRSLTRPDFAGQVMRMVEGAGFAPSDIVFEITEQQTILNPRAFASTLAHLRRLGFRIALDDFGVGFANLNLLLDLRPEYVKLPRYFTKGIHLDREKQEAVRAVRALASILGIPSIMEGIETVAELEVVRSLGIEFGQGYHFSHPLRADEVLLTPWFSSRAAPAWVAG